jgi:hypothetical protein
MLRTIEKNAYSLASFMSFFLLFEQGSLHFHLVLSPTNCIAIFLFPFFLLVGLEFELKALHLQKLYHPSILFWLLLEMGCHKLFMWAPFEL